MIKWVIELSQYRIHYKPRMALKGQVLAYFITELPQSEKQKDPTLGKWILYADGASKVSGAGVGVVLMAPIGEKIEQVVRLNFPASNNEAEYEVILDGLDLALTLFATNVEILSDLQLVVAQIQVEYEARDDRMACYLQAVKIRLSKFEEWAVRRIPREVNARADALAAIATTLSVQSIVLFPFYAKPSSSLEAPKILETRQLD